MTLRRALSANFAFLTLLILAVLAAVTGTAYVIERQKNIALAEGLDLSALHARAFEEHLTRSLKTIQTLVDFIAVGPDEENIDELFQRTLRQAPFLRSLSMLDTSGRIIASSNPGNIGLPLETGDYFPQVTAPHGSPLRIGRPWSGRDFNEGKEVSAEPPDTFRRPGFYPGSLPRRA